MYSILLKKVISSIKNAQKILGVLCLGYLLSSCQQPLQHAQLSDLPKDSVDTVQSELVTAGPMPLFVLQKWGTKSGNMEVTSAVSSDLYETHLSVQRPIQEPDQDFNPRFDKMGAPFMTLKTIPTAYCPECITKKENIDKMIASFYWGFANLETAAIVGGIFWNCRSFVASPPLLASCVGSNLVIGGILTKDETGTWLEKHLDDGIQVINAKLDYELCLANAECDPILKIPTGTAKLRAPLNKEVSGNIAVSNIGKTGLTFSLLPVEPWLWGGTASSGMVAAGGTGTANFVAKCGNVPGVKFGSIFVRARSEFVTAIGYEEQAMYGVKLTCYGSPMMSEPQPRPLKLVATVGSSTEGVVQFQNIGSDYLTFAFAVPAGDSWLTITSGATHSGSGLAPNGQHSIKVNATCTSEGSFSSSLLKTTNSGSSSGAVVVQLDCIPKTKRIWRSLGILEINGYGACYLPRPDLAKERYKLVDLLVLIPSFFYKDGTPGTHKISIASNVDFDNVVDNCYGTFDDSAAGKYIKSLSSSAISTFLGSSRPGIEIYNPVYRRGQLYIDIAY